MTDDRDFDRIARAWLELGPNEAPDRAVTAVLQAVETTPQVRPLSQRLPWRYPTVNRFPIAAAVAVAVVIVLGGILVLRPGQSGVGGPSPSASASPSPAVSAAPSASVATASEAIPGPIPVTPEAVVAVTIPFSMAFDGQDLWVTSETGTVVRIDPATNEADPPVALGAQLQGIAADASGIWVTQWSPGLVFHLDPVSHDVVARIDVGVAKGVLAAEGAIWVANTHDGTVTRIDPATNAIVTTIEVGSAGAGGPNWLTSGFGSIWVGDPLDSLVARIDPATNEIQASIQTPSSTSPCGGLVAGVDAVWITSCANGKSAARIDPLTNTAVEAVHLGGYALTFTSIDSLPWASIDMGGGTGAIVRIDPATNQVDRILTPTGNFVGGADMVVAAGSVWVVDAANDQVVRLPLAAFGP